MCFRAINAEKRFRRILEFQFNIYRSYAPGQRRNNFGIIHPRKKKIFSKFSNLHRRHYKSIKDYFFFAPAFLSREREIRPVPRCDCFKVIGEEWGGILRARIVPAISGITLKQSQPVVDRQCKLYVSSATCLN